MGTQKEVSPVLTPPGTASLTGRARGWEKDMLPSHRQLLLKHGYYSITF